MPIVRKQNNLTAKVSKFTDLTDTPNSYSGQAGRYPQVNGDEDALEFVNISGLDLDFLDDQTVYSCNVAVEVNDFVYLINDSTAALADKTQSANLPIIGAVVSKPTTTSCTIQTLGYLDGFTGLVPGDTYFLDTAGDISNTPTTTTGEVLYVVGVAKSATRLELRISSDYIIRS